jgi:hypothetical protein
MFNLYLECKLQSTHTVGQWELLQKYCWRCCYQCAESNSKYRDSLLRKLRFIVSCCQLSNGGQGHFPLLDFWVSDASFYSETPHLHSHPVEIRYPIFYHILFISIWSISYSRNQRKHSDIRMITTETWTTSHPSTPTLTQNSISSFPLDCYQCFWIVWWLDVVHLL